MDILVFGAGAVGGYLGARLCHSGHNVTLIIRGSASEAIEREGLTIIEGDQQIETKPAVVPSVRQAFINDNSYDLILLCTKAYDSEAALHELVSFCPKPPTLFTLQNGIGIEELYMAEFGPELVIAGSLTTPLSHETYRSIVVEHSDRGLALAPTESKADIKQWIKLFQEANVETVGIKDYRAMKWSKALVNMMGNASSAILNRHPRVIYNYGPTFQLEIDMLKETLAVMKKQKLKTVDLPGVPIRRLDTAVRRLPTSIIKPVLPSIVASGRGSKMPSFHVDLMAGKEGNEVVYHNGAVADAGPALGVSTPVNTALNEILQKLVRGELDYQAFNGQPKYLVAQVDVYRRAA